MRPLGSASPRLSAALRSGRSDIAGRRSAERSAERRCPALGRLGSARLGSALRSAPLSSDPNVCLCPAQILLNYLPLERALWSSLLKKQR